MVFAISLAAIMVVRFGVQIQKENEAATSAEAIAALNELLG